MNDVAIRPPAPAGDDRRSRLIPVSCLITVGTLLGLSTNLVKHAANRGMNPLTLLTWSVAGAALVVSFVNVVRGRMTFPDRRAMEYFVVAALVGVVVPNLLMYAAVPRVGAGFVTLSIAFPPLFTYLGALALRLERFDARRATGVGVALAGATSMAYMKLSAPEAPVPWIAATMLSPVILAFGNIYRTVRWPAGAAPEALAPGVLLVSGAVLITLGALAGFPLAVSRHGPFEILMIVLQTGLLSAQYILYFVLQKHGGPVLMSLLGSVAAVVGVPAAVLLLGEAPPAGLALGGVLIATGIVLLVRNASPAPAASGGEDAPVGALDRRGGHP